MEMSEESFKIWLTNPETPNEERTLVKKVFSYETYFRDMLFEPGTKPYKLIQCQAKDEKTGKWVKSEMPRPNELTCFCLTFFQYRVKEMDGYLGSYNSDEQLLIVTLEGLKKTSVILHEMIHMHESVINKLPMHFHDTLLWSLYQSLKKRIPNLDDILSDHAHLLTATSIYNQGGQHDILFLLKSFDLDIRKRYPLGTVFGYGRADDFSNYKYT